MHCKICGWNETHTTKFQEEQQQLVATFKVPPHHPYWLLSRKPYSAAAVGAGVLTPSVAGSAKVPQPLSVLAGLTRVID